MTIFNRIATTALTGLAALGFASASIASPNTTVPAEGSIAGHSLLADTIRAAGVTFELNHQLCQEEGMAGFYASTYRLLVVCQDNYQGNGPVDWTANDLDTLRHEAQHLIQDCMIGGIADGTLHPVYRDPIGLGFGVLGGDRMSGINTIYRQNGADTDTVILEWEAFAVAEMNVPVEQSQDIARYCGV